MRATLRVVCSLCGPISTLVVTTRTSDSTVLSQRDVVGEIQAQLQARYQIHDPGMRERTLRECPGQVTVSRMNHKPRARRAS